MPLTGKQKHHLRALAHKLKPVIIVGGAGISDAVAAETDNALSVHELIKVRINAADRETRNAMAADLSERTGSEIVQQIGNISVLYRAGEKNKVPLP